ncbi:MAG: SUMF1/EgtB/PvdO family nonheme iron enzyme, partial [Candidatus Omnitrophica bacterium]|nr:SUMF1/EgtB/PvdO family nonheme iron enzyme [Candidatus Omnitrophota bacterium]
MRFEFQVELAELNQPLQKLSETYRSYLEKQKEAFQKAGQLEGMLMVDEELKTFEANPSPTLSKDPELQRLQEIYRKKRAEMEDGEGGLSARRVALIQKFERKASDLATEWTKASRIEEAQQALAESKRFAEMEKIGGSVSVSAENFDDRKAGEEMRNGVGMKLCWIPAGKFVMGSPAGELGRDASREAQVEVELTQGFWMGKYEVTQEEFEKLKGVNPSRFSEVGKKAPVEQVSWAEAMDFCKLLTERERKEGKLPEGW